MTDPTAVLVTGTSSFWGARAAAALVAQPDLRVIGVDATPPADSVRGLDFIQADIRNRLMEDLIRSEGVEIVLHLAFQETSRPSEAAFDFNVMGTIRLLAAAVNAGVRKVVVRSSTAVYGAHPHNPAFLTETQPLHGNRRYGYTRDQVEIEAFLNGLRQQAPHVALTVLRFAHIVGPKADTPMTRFLRDLKTPVLLGFDPMMQVIHEDDVEGALLHSILAEAPGVFNVSAGPALPLWRLVRLAGKMPLPVPHPLLYAAVAAGRTGLAPLDPDLLRYPCVADTSRMTAELGFTPRYTSEEAVREFAGNQRLSRYLPESAALAYDEERLRDTIERRARARLQHAEIQGEER